MAATPPTSTTVETIEPTATVAAGRKVTLVGTVVAGETWRVTINATDYDVTAATGDDLAAIATKLATAIDAANTLNASASGAEITIRRDNGNLVDVSAAAPQAAVVATPPAVSTRALQVQGSVAADDEFIVTISGSEFTHKATDTSATAVAAALAASIDAATGLGAASEGDTLVITNPAGGAIDMTYQVKPGGSGSTARLSEPLTGVRFSADSNTGALSLSALGSVVTLGTLSTAGSLSIGEGDTFNFSIIDSGDSVSVMLSQVGNPQNVASASAPVTSTDSTASNQVIFSNSESDTKVPRSYLENVSIAFRSGVADDFSDELVNPPGQMIWNPVTNIPELGADVSETDGKLQLTQGGALVTVDEFDPANGSQPLVATGTWEFSNLAGGSDLLRIFTRSSGTPVSEVMDLGSAATFAVSNVANTITDGAEVSISIGDTTFTETMQSLDTSEAVRQRLVNQINETADSIASLVGDDIRIVVLPIDGTTRDVTSFDPAGATVTPNAGARIWSFADIVATTFVDNTTTDPPTTEVVEVVTQGEVINVSIGGQTFSHTVSNADAISTDPGATVRNALAETIDAADDFLAMVVDDEIVVIALADTPADPPIEASGTRGSVVDPDSGEQTVAQLGVTEVTGRTTTVVTGVAATAAEADVWTISVGGEAFTYEVASGDPTSDVLESLVSAINDALGAVGVMASLDGTDIVITETARQPLLPVWASRTSARGRTLTS